MNALDHLVDETHIALILMEVFVACVRKVELEIRWNHAMVCLL